MSKPSVITGGFFIKSAIISKNEIGYSQFPTDTANLTLLTTAQSLFRNK